MSQGAPYWGKLPKAAATTQAKPSRYSDDYASASGEKEEQPRQQHSRRKSNRISTQTTNTDAPTESTLSPFASPTRSSFLGKGLAPRPPSFPYPSPDIYPPDIADKRSHRQTRPHEDFDEDGEEDDTDAHHGPPPPAAPDAPRVPPRTYRHAFGNGGSPYNQSAAAVAARRAMHADPAAMDDEYYASSPRDDAAARHYPVLDRGRETFDSPPSQQPRTAVAVGGLPMQQVRKGSVKEVANAGRSFPLDTTNQPRKASTASQSGDRSRKFADDRSPLQRLELTLDSITKEEKRARAEAAEARAREKAARVDQADQSPVPRSVPRQAPRPEAKTQQPQVRFRDTSGSTGRGGGQSRSPRHGEPSPIAAHRGPLSQNPPEDRAKVRYPAGHQRSVSSGAALAAQNGGNGNTGIPKRNLSFRERAAREDIRPPNGMDDGASPEGPTPPRAAAPSSGFSLTRSGSNKLRKEPPGDPWYRLRMEAESAKQSDEDFPPAAASMKPSQAAPVGPSSGSSARNKDLPAVPVKSDPRVAPTGVKAKAANAPAIEFGGVRRAATEPISSADGATGKAVPGDFQMARKKLRGPGSDSDSDSSKGEHHHYASRVLYRPGDLRPGEGLYLPPQFLDEWKHATVGLLGGSLLDLTEDDSIDVDKDKTWWEGGVKQRSIASRPRRAEAFDGEYDESNAPTRFKPPLFLKCGPLLRYCGIRKDSAPTRGKGSAVSEREFWRGSVMIVTRDADSQYDIAPTLRMFLQPIELLPPPPAEVDGELSPEYVDPIAGHPKLGRRGETLYVRPVEHLDEARDLSMDETEDGLFESTRSPPDVAPPDGSTDLPGSFASRRKRIEIDGEKVSKYKEVRGFRLHTERGCTFWRFNLEVELGERQQRIAYRINRGPAMGFWVPARGTSMNIMFYSCNGFSTSVRTDDFCGPDPMWRDVLNTHQTQPFHVMVGGGDQIYNDVVEDECPRLGDWMGIRNPVHKHTAPFTPQLQDELETFYLERYCMWFSQGLFGLANSQIPMVNMYDDHDVLDGYGSYPHHFMNSPVIRGLGAVAFKYYMLFQHQSVMDETEATEPSWIISKSKGPYMGEMSRSLYVDLGADLSLLAVDCRTERTEYDVISEDTWKQIMDRCFKDLKGGHLLVVLGVPVAYPRLVWLENILTSRVMHPVKALSKTGVFGNVLNHIDGGAEVLDDLNDHWTARNHKYERREVIEQLQDLAMITSVRVTILSGDVHLGAVGRFCSHPRLGLPKHKDPRYMPNVISSAMANAPPSNLLADVLNKRNKVHHFDRETEEDMIPMFQNGVDGKPRNNKHLLPHRNWCSIRTWAPGDTPPPSPGPSAYDRSPSPPLITRSGTGGSLLRRFSLSKGPSHKPDVPRPPISGSGSGGLFRSFSWRGSQDPSRAPQRLQRSPSQSKSSFSPAKLLGLERPPKRPAHPDDGGINGQWGDETPGYDEDEHDDDDEYYDPRGSRRDHRQEQQPQQTTRLRGGASPEYAPGDDSYFTAKQPRRAFTAPNEQYAPREPEEESFKPKPFHRTPTGLSVKQLRRAEEFEVDLEGGLDISLNVEINPRDPAGITVPYRLLVPKLFYAYDADGEEEDGAAAAAAAAAAEEERRRRAQPPPERKPSTIQRLLSFRSKQRQPPPPRQMVGEPETPPPGGGGGPEYDDDETPPPTHRGARQPPPRIPFDDRHQAPSPAAPAPTVATRREPIAPRRDEDLYYDEDDDYSGPVSSNRAQWGGHRGML